MSAPARRPGPFNPARELAVRIVHRVLTGDTFAAPALDSALQQARLPGRDAGLATHLVYGTLRHLNALRQALAPLLREETHPKVEALLLSGAFEKLFLGTPPHAVVNEYVNLASGARLAPAGLVNAVLRRVALTTTPDPAQELPDWLAETYRQVFAGQAEAVFASLLEPQPLWLSLSEAGVQSLLHDGAQVRPGPQGLDQVSLARPLRDTEAYQDGQAQPINPASLASVDALSDAADLQGQRVLDLAGGAGVKAAMLAARGAQVTSVDLSARKHDLARRNLQRLGLQAHFIAHDLTRPLHIDAAPFVLLDAPCSGTGTLRSHPEIKLRVTPQTVQEMAALQAQLLPNAAALVQPGGALVYSVCAVTPQEGPQVIEAFLRTHPEFTPEDIAQLEVPSVPAGPGRLTLPLAGVDGFYIARLRRQA